jgi:hypothetical protein
MTARIRRQHAPAPIIAFGGVVLRQAGADQERPDLKGVTVFVEPEGLGLELQPGGRHSVMAWDRVRSLELDGSDEVTELMITTDRATHRFSIPATRATVEDALLGHLPSDAVDGLRHEEAEAPSADAAQRDDDFAVTSPDDAEAPEAPDLQRLAGWHRYQPALVTLLIVVLCTCIALLLAQSAGAIHLPILGNSGAGPP